MTFTSFPCSVQKELFAKFSADEVDTSDVAFVQEFAQTCVCGVKTLLLRSHCCVTHDIVRDLQTAKLKMLRNQTLNC